MQSSQGSAKGSGGEAQGSQSGVSFRGVKFYSILHLMFSKEEDQRVPQRVVGAKLEVHKLVRHN